MLSRRETEILSLNAVGLSAKEIAQRLFISPETVRKTFSNAKEKTGLNKASELASYFTCFMNGINYDEFKKQIIAASMLLIFIIGDINQITNYTIYRRRNIQTERRAARRSIVENTLIL